MKTSDDERFIGQVRVGPKGQIVIPKDVREMFGIEPGDTLMLLAHKKRGIALERASVFHKIADAIFAGKGKEIYPENDDETSLAFAQAIKQAEREDEE